MRETREAGEGQYARDGSCEGAREGWWMRGDEPVNREGCHARRNQLGGGLCTAGGCQSRTPCLLV